MVLVPTAAVTFYLKDYLQKRADYRSLRQKLEQIAGKEARVLYSLGPGANVGIGPQLFKIHEIDKHGVVLKNELQTVFVPTAKLVQSEMVLPSDDWKERKKEKMREDIADFIEPVFEAVKEHLLEDFQQEEGEFSAVIGFHFEQYLEKEGYDIELKKLKGPNDSDSPS